MRVLRSRWRVCAAMRSTLAPLAAAVVAWPARREYGTGSDVAVWGWCEVIDACLPCRAHHVIVRPFVVLAQDAIVVRDLVTTLDKPQERAAATGTDVTAAPPTDRLACSYQFSALRTDVRVLGIHLHRQHHLDAGSTSSLRPVVIVEARSGVPGPCAHAVLTPRIALAGALDVESVSRAGIVTQDCGTNEGLRVSAILDTLESDVERAWTVHL